jgi:hypothetical protein
MIPACSTQPFLALRLAGMPGRLPACMKVGC